jgi:hypothetical protein
MTQVVKEKLYLRVIATFIISCGSYEANDMKFVREILKNYFYF